MIVGLVGLGKMGSIHYRVLQSLVLEGKVDKVNVCDVKNIPNNMPLHTLLDQSDCVVVATPTHEHKKIVDCCLQLGKPVFCEKPLSDGFMNDDLLYQKWASTDNPEGRAMLFVGYIERYNAALRYLQTLLTQVKNDPTDKILYFSTRRVNGVSPDIMKGREIITDLGVHDFDTLRYLFGDIRLHSSRIIADKNKAVFAQSLFILDKNIFCDSVISWIDSFKRREYIVYTVKKVITVDLLIQKVSILNKLSGNREEYTFSVEPAYVEMLEFLKFVEKGEPVSVPDPLGLGAQKIALEMLNLAEVIDI